MNKRAAKILTVWIPFPVYRKRVRNFLNRMSWDAWRAMKECGPSYEKFLAHTPAAKTVLVVEPNHYHAEIVPGYAQYWLDMGYRVDVLLTPKNHQENAFVRLKDARLTFFPMPLYFIKKALKARKPYDYVFISSADYAGSRESFLSFLGFRPSARKKVFGVFHDAQLIEPCMKKSPLLDAVFTLSAPADHSERLLCPIYFGPVQKTSKHTPIRFLSVGRLTENVRDVNALFEAIRALIRQNQTHFTVTLVGSGCVEIPDDLKSFIHTTGRLTFEQLFQECEGTDFLLALLNSQNAEQRTYATSKTTGTKALSLAFHKPMLAEEIFASSYGLSNANTVTYGAGRLLEAMQKAIGMSSKEYEKMQESLDKAAADIYQTSLNNLKRAMAS